MKEAGSPLDDFPLHGDPAVSVLATAPAAPREVEILAAPTEQTASLAARATSAAADAAVVLLLTALAILAARVATGVSPSPAGIGWAAGFAGFLSFFATVPPLVLFGKTVGMALAEISARPEPGAGLSAAAAARRWLGTLLTAATAGLALLWTRSDPHAPTPADRLSGNALTVD